ncbi:hypothetical protein ERJ75_000892600 [Trypanosoma vivax]|nr:hypothetical protein TRVL_05629 [Trypanosoma vivax]KAH8612413.1 hypothetical protein ERJ75_000892600 [Trypanosoma vivax]
MTPTLHPVRKDWGGLEADGYQRGSMQHHRRSGANEVLQLLPCTCGRAALDARRLLLLIIGGVERKPGPLIRGAQWNSGGLPGEAGWPGEEAPRGHGFVLSLAGDTPGVGGVCRAKNRRMPARGPVSRERGINLWLEREWV